MSSPPRVVILGGGFGGLAAARALRRAPVAITLLDRRNHHVFQPLLYQVATAGLSAPEIAAPIRRILWKQKNVTVLMAEAQRVDVARRRVVVPGDEIAYDFLIVATGATHSYFGHDTWASHAPGLKSLDDALEIRRRILSAFEAAEREADPQRRSEWLTFVVVGAGATGVELSGTLTEVAFHTLSRDFRYIDPRTAKVTLLEGADRVLPLYPPDLSAKAKEQLERLGVDVRTGAKVTDVDAAGVQLGTERIAARTVLWAAGVAASPLGQTLGAPLDRAGRVKVERDLSLTGHPEVFVIGDLVALEQHGKPLPGVAPAAMQMGTFAGRSIGRALRNEPRGEFRYVDKGTLATIGRRAAVAQIGGLKLSGFVAWFAWLAIHIFFLIGFRNRFYVIFDWAWAYITYERSARLILGPQETHEAADPVRS
jgi:NADH dehydrogenase